MFESTFIPLTLILIYLSYTQFDFFTEKEEKSTSINLSWIEQEVPRSIVNWKQTRFSEGLPWKKDSIECLETNSNNIIYIVNFKTIPYDWIRRVDEDKNIFFDQIYIDNWSREMQKGATLNLKAPITH